MFNPRKGSHGHFHTHGPEMPVPLVPRRPSGSVQMIKQYCGVQGAGETAGLKRERSHRHMAASREAAVTDLHPNRTEKKLASN